MARGRLTGWTHSCPTFPGSGWDQEVALLSWAQGVPWVLSVGPHGRHSHIPARPHSDERLGLLPFPGDASELRGWGAWGHGEPGRRAGTGGLWP